MKHPTSIIKLKNLESTLSSKIVGQGHVIPRVCSVLSRGELGFANRKRPKGSFLFVGPTGTGKTELALAFTDYLFGEGSLIRFDMSEFMFPESLSRLIGEGRGDVGLLGNRMKKVPKGTILFDEMEKAHPKILDIFLQILDAGQVTLGDGSVQLFQDYYIVFTSNIGSSEIRSMVRSPLSTIERVVMNEVNEALRPEFIARINEKIVFKNLDFDTLSQICALMLSDELERYRELGYQLTPLPEVKTFLLGVGFHKSLGARPMRNAIEKHIGDLITGQILSGSATSGYITVNQSKTALELLAAELKPSKKQELLCCSS